MMTLVMLWGGGYILLIGCTAPAGFPQQPPTVGSDHGIPAGEGVPNIPSEQVRWDTPWFEQTVGMFAGRIRARGWSIAFGEPTAPVAVVGMIPWGWRPDGEPDGEVWVTVIRGGRIWGPTRVSDPIAVRDDVGRVAVAVTRDTTTMWAWFGDGMLGLSTVGTIYEVMSEDGGLTWSSPRAVADGSVQGLRWDERMHGLHAVRVGPATVADDLWYGRSAPVGQPWQWERIPLSFPVKLAAMDIATDRVTETPIVAVIGLGDHQGGIAIRTDHNGWVTWPLRHPTVADAEPPAIRLDDDGSILAAWAGYGRSTIGAARLVRDTTRAVPHWTDLQIEVLASDATHHEPRSGDVFAEDVSIMGDRRGQRTLVTWVTRWSPPPQVWPPPRHTQSAWWDHRRQGWVGIDRPDRPTDIDDLDPTRHVVCGSDAEGLRGGCLLIDYNRQAWHVSWQWMVIEQIGIRPPH